MIAVWTMALRNLQRRKLQSLLVGMVIGLSVLLFFTGVGLMKELSGPFEAMVEEQRASHLSLKFDSRIYDPSEIAAWWQARPEVVSVTPPMASLDLSESSYSDGVELTSLLYVSERPWETLEQDDLELVQGEPARVPGPGEVWIPTSIASESSLEPGDVLEVPGFDGLRSLEITAVVIDPQHSGLFNNPKRIWMGPGQLPYHFDLKSLSNVLVGVRLSDEATLEPLWDEFVENLGGSYSGQKIDYAGMRLGYMAPYNLMGAMLISFSILSILIALFAIHGTITSSILADFRTIGILRAQGFRPKDVRNIYRLQYLVMALVAVPVGVLLGIPLVRQGVTLLMSTIGSASEGGSLLLIGAGTTIVFLALVWLFVGRIAKRAERVRPAEAIRSGAEASNTGSTTGPSVRFLSRFGVPSLMAVKNLWLQRRRALLLMTSVLFATLAASLAVNLDYSFQRGGEDPSLLGFDNADVRIIRGGKRFGMRHDTLLAVLEAHPDVVSIATSDFVEGELLLDGGRTAPQVGFLVAGDVEGLSYRTLAGRNPETDDEVVIGINTSKRHGLEIGDTYPLFIRGQRLDLEITGLFQSLNNGGTGFRMRLGTIRKADPLYEPTRYGLVLRAGAEPDVFMEAIEAEYGEAVDAQPGDYFLRSIMSTVVTGMRISNGFLATVFLLAASVFIFNSTLMSIAENRRTFGILKTVGMTPAQLRASVVLGVGIVACLGIALGLVAWRIGAPIGLSLLFSSLGLVSFPLQNSLVGTLALIPIILGFCLLSGFLPSARLLDLDPRSLIVE